MRKLLYLLLILPMIAVSQENESFLLNLSEITVKPGHDAQFLEGVKSWKKCYVDSEGKDKWNMWRRVQGKGSVYTLTSTMANWAEMDDESNNFKKTFFKVHGEDSWDGFVETWKNTFSNSWDEIWEYNANLSGR